MFNVVKSNHFYVLSYLIIFCNIVLCIIPRAYKSDELLQLITNCAQDLELLELLESSVIGKQNTLVGLYLVTSTVATTSLVGYSQF